MENAIRKQTEEKMKHAVEALRKHFGTVRTGRASLGILDGLNVDYYGTPTPLQQVATLNTPDPKTITIQPWDGKMLQAVEKALQKSDLGLTPSNDGHVIRINIPALTEERRRDLVKVIKKMSEEARVAIRNIRREANDGLKKLEKDEHVSKDEVKKSLDEVQKLTDGFIAKVDEAVAHKEKEIMEV